MKKETIYIIAGIILAAIAWFGYASSGTKAPVSPQTPSANEPSAAATSSNTAAPSTESTAGTAENIASTTPEFQLVGMATTTASTTEEILSSMTVAQIVNVDISGFAFSPAEVKVKVGDTIRWTNSDSAGHQIVSDNPAFGLASPMLSNGATYPFTLMKAGTVSYRCSVHPAMKGTIIVE